MQLTPLLEKEACVGPDDPPMQSQRRHSWRLLKIGPIPLNRHFSFHSVSAGETSHFFQTEKFSWLSVGPSANGGIVAPLVSCDKRSSNMQSSSVLMEKLCTGGVLGCVWLCLKEVRENILKPQNGGYYWLPGCPENHVLTLRQGGQWGFKMYRSQRKWYNADQCTDHIAIYSQNTD